MLEDIRTCRATTFLGASWILVFAAMHLFQWFEITAGPRPGTQLLGFGQVGVETAHLFGALRWSDVTRGEVWRLVTATFIHFNVLHLLMNLVGLMQLGWLMEPWYGSRQFLAILLSIGGLGNLFGGLLRIGFTQLRAAVESSGMGKLLPDFIRNGALPAGAAEVTSGGGSTIILGMIGLAMIVGWRSKTRVGMFLRDQMIGFLGFTALLGVILAKLVDNYGHLGGTIAGVAFGFIHRPLVHTAENGWFRRAAGAAAVGLLLVCFTAQGWVGYKTLDRGYQNARMAGELERIARRGQTTQEVIQLLEKIDNSVLQLEVLQDPIGVAEVDWPEPLGYVGPERPSPSRAVMNLRAQVKQQLQSLIASLNGARQTLDADLADQNLDQIITTAQTALLVPLSAREIYQFQTLTREVARKAADRQKNLSDRFQQLNEALRPGTP